MTEPTYTVFIRVPVPRGDFVDPPSVSWDVSKDEQLWAIVSSAAQTELDWQDLATHFDATVPFLLQQATYLTERHASQVRAQLRKATVAAKGTNAAPSPVPGGEPVGGLLGHHRTASALSLRRDSPMPIPTRHDSGAGTPVSAIRPNISRNTSGTTLSAIAVHNNLAAAGPATPSRTKPPPLRPIDTQSTRKRLPSLPISTPVDPPSPGAADSPAASSDESSESSSPAQSRIIRRPPRFQQPNGGSFTDDYDDDDDPEPVFQFKSKPLAQQHRQPSAQDLTATLRGDPRDFTRMRSGNTTAQQSQTSDSSIGSLSVVSRGAAGARDRRRPAAGAGQSSLPPRRAGAVGGGKSGEGSEGTPSMGSSYSDLDDASVTQSAMEEAFLSNMKDGGASRFSIGGAFRSRLGPKFS